MQHLPITRMTLYKHGVGFFERRAQFEGEEVELSFRVEEMNDILKSLTAIDWGGGRVLGVDYATPQSREERLAGCSIRLDDARSLRDLLVGLRGRQVRLLLDQEEALAGILLGLDEVDDEQPLATALVSVLRDAGAQVAVAPLGRVQGVEILDERGAGDLRFFLQTALSQELYRSVTIRLTPGGHELSVSYIAPAPTWRVSYRLVADPPDAEGAGKALLQGWGIFDNRLEEDLKGISLSLVAGMPISFVYDLYTPFTPKRPVVEEEARVAAAPVEFEAESFRGAIPEAPPAHMGLGAGLGMAKMQAMAAPEPMSRAALSEAAQVTTKGAELGELFQYSIETPVTVGRGQSAMVPIIASDLDFHKDLLYNGRKLPAHPVATLRLRNTVGLTLERGPVTVIEGGEYVGEAVLPFTVTGGEVVVPYAVELGVKISEQSINSREIRRLDLKGAYLQFEEWQIRRQDYRLTNTTARPVTVLIEHPRNTAYDLFDTPQPKERTDEMLRFAVTVVPQSETTFKVQERQLTRRQEELQRQSYAGLQRYLKQGLLDQHVLDQVSKLLMLWDTIADYEKKLAELETERTKIYTAQQQIQGNMGALSQTGKEGALRARYVEQLESSEEQLKALGHKEAEYKAAIAQVKADIEARLSMID